MQKLFVGLAFLHLAVIGAWAQSPAQSLSLDEQNKVSEIVTNQTARPLTHINFALQRDAVIPSDVAIERLPAEAEKVAPQLKGYSYLAVEELVAIVDTASRKVVSVMPRMRRQQSTGSAN